jgi:tRNA(fMet)-specific endonuclease VapC
MALIVADTDVLIDFLRGQKPFADRVGRSLESGTLATTTLNRFELLSGARSSRQLGILVELMNAMPCLPLDLEAADRAADIRRSLEKRGLAIGMGDSLIAGIVLARRSQLLTRNIRHFERVPNLRLAAPE